MSMRLGYVVATHPEDHSVDIVMADDSSRLIGVQVVTPNGSGRSGTFDMPAVPEKANKWDITKRTDQDQIAIVGFIGKNPVVLGFLYPQVNQMAFDDPKRRLTRHQSDVYSTVDGDGNMELYHPSGAFARIGEKREHEDLTGKNTDAKLSISRNTSRRLNIHVEQAGKKMVLNIDPDGNIELEHDGYMEWITHRHNIRKIDEFHSLAIGKSSTETIGEAWTVTVGDAITFSSGVAVTINAPVTTINSAKIILNGEVFIAGDLNVHGATKLLDVSSNSKDISDKHTHDGVTPGGGISGTVVPGGPLPSHP